MNSKIRKTLVAGLAAITVAGTLATTAAPAQAWGYHHGGFGWGAAGLVGGLMLGGALAANAAQQPVYNCGRVRQRMYDNYGYFIGYRWVSAC
jgi:Spy/CpxP family protein refolding chaperone